MVRLIYRENVDANYVSYLGQLPEARALVPLPALSCFIALEIIGLCPVGGALAPLP